MGVQDRALKLYPDYHMYESVMLSFVPLFLLNFCWSLHGGNIGCSIVMFLSIVYQ